MTDWPDPIIERQAEAPIGSSPVVTIGVMRRELCVEVERPPPSPTDGPRPGVPETRRGLGSRAPLEHRPDLTLI